jgi:hypothetical protein
MKWKRLLILVIVSAVGVTLAFLIRSRVRAAAQREREAGYPLALRAYSEIVQPGMTRKEVENALRSRATSFSKILGPFGGTAEYGDLVKIGEEDAPWYCSEEYVYVAFVFSAVEKHDLEHHLGADSDVLKKVQIFRPDTGCL